MLWMAFSIRCSRPRVHGQTQGINTRRCDCLTTDSDVCLQHTCCALQTRAAPASLVPKSWLPATRSLKSADMNERDRLISPAAARHQHGVSTAGPYRRDQRERGLPYGPRTRRSIKASIAIASRWPARLLFVLPIFTFIHHLRHAVCCRGCQLHHRAV